MFNWIIINTWTWSVVQQLYTYNSLHLPCINLLCSLSSLYTRWSRASFPGAKTQFSSIKFRVPFIELLDECRLRSVIAWKQSARINFTRCMCSLMSFVMNYHWNRKLKRMKKISRFANTHDENWQFSRKFSAIIWTCAFDNLPSVTIDLFQIPNEPSFNAICNAHATNLPTSPNNKSFDKQKQQRDTIARVDAGHSFQGYRNALTENERRIFIF